MSAGTLAFPPGGRVELRGRGSPWVWDATGPQGAPTVVLLHGWTSTAALNWCATMQPLSREFRVLAPDHRGHGRGIRSRRPFRLEDCADDVAALIGVTGATKAVVVGYSMGGAIAQLVARRHPEMLAGLVLSATAARFGFGQRSSVATGPLGQGLVLAVGGIPRPIRRMGYQRFVEQRTVRTDTAPWAVEEWKGSDPAALMQAGLALGAFDSTGWLRDIVVPTAVIATTRDNVVSPQLQRQLAEAIPGATLLEVEGDHRACVDAARTFVPTLAGACRQLAGARPAPAAT